MSHEERVFPAGETPGAAGDASSRGEPRGEGAMGETMDEPSITYPAIQGLTTGSPSGGIAGGTPAAMVEPRMEERAEELVEASKVRQDSNPDEELEWERDPTYEEVA